MKFSKETVKKVWDDEVGTHIYVGPGADITTRINDILREIEKHPAFRREFNSIRF